MKLTGFDLRSGLVLTLAAMLTLATACSRDTQPSEPETTLDANDPGPLPGGPVTPGDGQDPDEVEKRFQVAKQARQAQAARLVKEGRDLYLQARYEDALKSLTEARYLDPTNKEVDEVLARVTSALDQRAGAVADQAVREELKRQVALARARMQVDSLVATGDLQLDTGDYDAAVRSYEDALMLVMHGPYGIDLSIDRTQIENRLSTAREKQKEASRTIAQATASEVMKAKAADDEREAAQRDTRIKNLLLDANRSFQRGRYDEADQRLDWVLKIAEPDSDYAREAETLKGIIKSSRVERAESENRTAMAEQWKRVMEDLKLSTLIPTSVVEVPSDWSETVGRRKPKRFGRAARTMSEEDKAIERRLDSQTVKLNFEDESQFTAVLDHLSKVSRIAFVPSKGVAEKLAEGITLSAINTQLQLRAALQLVLDMAGNFKYRIDDGLVMIILPEEAKADTYLDFYEVKDLVNPVKDYPGVEINLSPSGAEEEEASDDEETNQNFEPDRLVDLIKNNIARETWDEDPVAYSANIQKGILIIKHSDGVHGQIRELLRGLRKSAALMVALEARFLLVEDNFLEDIGVDFRGLGDNSQGTGVPGLGTGVSLDDFGASGSPGGVGTPENPAGPGTSSRAGVFFNDNSDGDIRARTENLYDSLLGNPDVLTGSGGLALQLTYLDDTEVSLILRAVRKSERVNVVTAPRITVFNTERANVTVLNQVSYVKDFDAEIAQAAAIVEPVVDVIQDGVVLDVRPIISSDRRYITMDLRPTVAQLTRPIPQFTASVATGTPVTLELPRLEVQRVRTTVTIPDDATVLLGGLKFSEEEEKFSGIPWISDIPVIGFLAGRRGKYVSRRNLLILLKAKIVIPDEVVPQTPIGG